MKNGSRTGLARFRDDNDGARIHKTLRVTRAMAAGITDKLWTMEDIVALMDARAPKRGPRKAYSKRKRT